MAYNKVPTELPRIENPWKLSPSESEVLRLMADGKDASLVGFLMGGISHKTVSTFLYKAKDKLRAETSTHAVVIWDRFLRDGIKST